MGVPVPEQKNVLSLLHRLSALRMSKVSGHGMAASGLHHFALLLLAVRVTALIAAALPTIQRRPVGPAIIHLNRRLGQIALISLDNIKRATVPNSVS
jgi:hypothetical protein